MNENGKSLLYATEEFCSPGKQGNSCLNVYGSYCFIENLQGTKANNSVFIKVIVIQRHTCIFIQLFLTKWQLK